jgi:two-component system OmpR family sensor kinase
LAFGAATAAILAVAGPSVTLYAQGSPASLALVVGGALSVIVLAWLVLRGRYRRQTEQEKTEVASEAVRTQRRTFLMRLDHELKNPITAMRAAVANLTALVEPGDPAVAQALESIDAQAVRLNRLTADLRKIAEVETQTIRAQPVDVPQLLNEVKSAVQNTSGRQVRLIIYNTPSPVGAVAGDKDLLFLAVHNLVSNAAKFCSPIDTIELRAFNDPPWIVIEVADNGPGIPADELGLIWEELGRARNARGFPGSGLGLSLVRTIVARHGGQVELHSHEGEGTLFALRLHPTASTRTQRLDVAVTPPR